MVSCVKACEMGISKQLAGDLCLPICPQRYLGLGRSAAAMDQCQGHGCELYCGCSYGDFAAHMVFNIRSLVLPYTDAQGSMCNRTA